MAEGGLEPASVSHSSLLMTMRMMMLQQIKDEEKALRSQILSLRFSIQMEISG